MHGAASKQYLAGQFNRAVNRPIQHQYLLLSSRETQAFSVVGLKEECLRKKLPRKNPSAIVEVERNHCPAHHEPPYYLHKKTCLRVHF